MLACMENVKKASELRAAVRALGTRGQGRRYPEQVKRDVLAYLADRRKAGRGVRTVAQEVGIPWKTVKLWAAPPRPAPPPSFVPMKLVTESGREPIVVHAGPLRIEGLDVAALADLLRRLA
jgi:hypothetical protein